MSEITEEQWEDTYKPVKNHLDKNASWDGEMFETYGEEEDFVFSQDYHYVWTYVEGDEGKGYLVNGKARVNRIGFFVCEKPWIEGEQIEIKIDDYDQTEEEGDAA